MHAFRVETTITSAGSVLLDHLPFQPGEAVEVIILSRVATAPTQNPYPLRGLAICDEAPTEPVALSEWESIS